MKLSDEGAEDSGRVLFVRGISYAGEHAVRLGLTAAVGILVARYLGPEGLGLLSYAHSVFGILLPVALLGLPSLLAREVSTGTNWRAALASVLTAQTPVALVVSLFGFWIIAVSRDFETQAVLTALVMLPIPLLTLNESIRAYLEATGRSRTILIAGVTASLASSAIKIGAILIDANIWVFALAGTVELSLVTLGLVRGVPARARISSLRAYAQISLVRDLTRESWPLLLSALAITVYMRIDIVMLGMLVGDEETGIYAAASRLSEVWYFLPMAALAAIRPVLSRLHAGGDIPRYEMLLQRLMSSAAVVAYAAVAVILIAGPRLITFLYGADFASAAPVLQIHVLAAPFVFLGVAASPWFIDRRLSRAVLVRSTTGAVVNVLLNLLLLPSWGARGAALATLISYSLSGVLLNGLLPSGRRVFSIQIKALALWRVAKSIDH